MHDGMTDANLNPYQSPLAKPSLVKPVQAIPPCPRCNSHNAAPTPYSRLHGHRTTKEIQDLTCPDCKCNFNGETGIEYPARQFPIAGFFFTLVIVGLYILLMISLTFG